MKLNKTLNIVLILGILIALSSCANSASTATTIAGFWNGLWHGIILPFSFIISLFDPSISIYASVNSGSWYDLGFVIGAGSHLSIIKRK